MRRENFTLRVDCQHGIGRLRSPPALILRKRLSEPGRCEALFRPYETQSAGVAGIKETKAEQLTQRIEKLRTQLDDAEETAKALLAVGHLAALYMDEE